MVTHVDPSTFLPFSSFDSATILATGNPYLAVPLASNGGYGQGHPPTTHTGFSFDEPEFDVATLQHIAARLTTSRLVIAHEHETATSGKEDEQPNIPVPVVPWIHVVPRNATEAASLERIKKNLADDSRDLDRKPTGWKEVE